MTGQFWVIDYRLYNPDGDGNSKLDHVQDMIESAYYAKQLPFAIVLMDSWYAAKKLMAASCCVREVLLLPLENQPFGGR